MSLNHVVIQGNLGKDPDTKYIANGTCITQISVAVNRKWKDAEGESKEEVSFIPCVAFGRTAEVIAEYFKQGSEIIIEGRLKQDTWEDKETDKKRSAIKVTIEGFNFTSGSKTKKKGDDDDRPSKRDDDDRPKKKSKIDDSDVPSRSVREKKSKKQAEEDDVPFSSILDPIKALFGRLFGYA